ncbi:MULTISPECIES: MFS transporter [unclassified Janthinobacterium]|uniref:MFS transporter n=1 Tax=unclassified Janthinobacterium TaxID=2610881 RepID=UPI001E4CA3B3|nr:MULTISPECIES: MFS transporter [unclassified Janthinobacterium]MCC7643645.1 MFS transporter [Janthinobacterium sp. EB271-G4-3-1]MCC7691387.1 MFS transporter [Janthinobacterium sp. EB271-G4-3-2]
MSTTTQPRLLRNTNFRWLLGGGLVSMLGDQFSMLALPWLVLSLTNDSLSLGIAVALMGAPRAVLILLGGTIADRYSPRHVLLLSKYANAAILLALSGLLMLDQASVALAYAAALALGIASAFGIPAGTAILPQAVPPQALQTANSLQMGARQLSLLAGPLLAALVLGAHDGGQHTSMAALAAAFAIDALTFLFSAWTLRQVTLRPQAAAAAQGMWRDMAAGLSMVWRDLPLRSCYAYWAVVAFFVMGPLQVALPVLAGERLHGAPALGLLMGAHGAGTLAGMLAFSLGGAWLRRRFGATLLAVDAIVAILLMALGQIDTAWQGAALLAVTGLLGGYVQVAIFTWIQRRVAPAMLGRAMALFMGIFLGLAPLSAAATGALLRHLRVGELFCAGGALLLAAAIAAALLTDIARIASTDHVTQA